MKLTVENVSSSNITERKLHQNWVCKGFSMTAVYVYIVSQSKLTLMYDCLGRALRLANTKVLVLFVFLW